MLTSDGSTTIHLSEWNEQYHSKHGAILEAFHVFIKNGLDFISKTNISVLEMGFGTGLNAFITFLESQKSNQTIHYTAIEAYPVEENEISKLNYVAKLKAEAYQTKFHQMHLVSWNKKHKISNTFTLLKKQQFFEDFNQVNQFDLIYFDAFGARVQPQLWTEFIFEKMFCALKNEGILVTYAAKGSVRRAMQSVGFIVDRLPGPPGKREMLRAIKK